MTTTSWLLCDVPTRTLFMGKVERLYLALFVDAQHQRRLVQPIETEPDHVRDLSPRLIRHVNLLLVNRIE